MKKIVIASTSTLHNGSYLEYLTPTLKSHFTDVAEIIFVPFARPGGISHDDYTARAASYFNEIGIGVKGLHEFDDKKQAIKNAKGIFVGGGNTFVLVSQLYQYDLIKAIKEVVENGTPYLGSSAGSNICGLTMGTTNDMPIMMPPSYKTFSFVPFNVNPHYLDPIEGSTHMGETRETRIKEFHFYNTQPVVGLREGSWLEVYGNKIVLKGDLKARIFKQNIEPYEVETGIDLSDLK